MSTQDGHAAQPWLKHGWIKQKRAYLEARTRAMIVHRAWRDPEFRERLLADPRAALAAVLDLRIPDDVEIEIVQEAEGEMTLVLPHMPESSRPPGTLAGASGRLDACSTHVLMWTGGCTGTC
ncbi:nitrile hydratase subunit alpha [Longimicrobium sp.]|jgi:hypothetical protein|uniref:nitrile hydratase subunit alpha n=1 Tax=Longimicrobium sp. TaxID=2029185 RepID=UPI002F95BA6B